MDHGEWDWEWPVVELVVEDVLVVHDDGEAKEDPDYFCFGFEFSSFRLLLYGSVVFIDLLLFLDVR